MSGFGRDAEVAGGERVGDILTFSGSVGKLKERKPCWMAV